MAMNETGSAIVTAHRELLDYCSREADGQPVVNWADTLTAASWNLMYALLARRGMDRNLTEFYNLTRSVGYPTEATEFYNAAHKFAELVRDI